METLKTGNIPVWQLCDSLGKPMSGAKLYTYAAGTNTPLETYQDAAGNNPNSNPVIFDSAGRATIWFQALPYKLTLTDAQNNVIWEIDNYIMGIPSTVNICNTMADLNNISGMSGDIAILLGYYAINDGGSGKFYWDANSTVTVDGGTYISGTPLQAGRWVRTWDNQEVNILCYGAFNQNNADNAAIFATANNYCSAHSYKIVVPAGTYRLDTNPTMTVPIKLLPDAVFYYIGFTPTFNVQIDANDETQHFYGNATLTWTLPKGNIVYPEWFGAKGDYIEKVTASQTPTDDTQAFNRAMCAIKNGGVLQLKNKTYQVSDQLYIYGGITVRGYGDTSIIKTKPVQNTAYSGLLFDGADIEDNIFEDMAFDGAVTTGTAQCKAISGTYSNLLVRNCVFANINYKAIEVGGNYNNIIGNTFIGCNSAGINTTKGSNIVIRGNSLYADAGLSIAIGCSTTQDDSNIIIEDNYCEAAIFATCSTVTTNSGTFWDKIRNLQVVNNTVDMSATSSPKYCIYLNGMLDTCKVIGNKVLSSKVAGGIYVGDSSMLDAAYVAAKTYRNMCRYIIQDNYTLAKNDSGATVKQGIVIAGAFFATVIGNSVERNSSTHPDAVDVALPMYAGKIIANGAALMAWLNNPAIFATTPTKIRITSIQDTTYGYLATTKGSAIAIFDVFTVGSSSLTWIATDSDVFDGVGIHETGVNVGTYTGNIVRGYATQIVRSSPITEWEKLSTDYIAGYTTPLTMPAVVSTTYYTTAVPFNLTYLKLGNIITLNIPEIINDTGNALKNIHTFTLTLPDEYTVDFSGITPTTPNKAIPCVLYNSHPVSEVYILYSGLMFITNTVITLWINQESNAGAIQPYRADGFYYTTAGTGVQRRGLPAQTVTYTLT